MKSEIEIVPILVSLLKQPVVQPGSTITATLNGFAEINYDGTLVEDSKWTTLDISDSLKEIQEELIKILTTKRESSDKRVGALTVFSTLG